MSKKPTKTNKQTPPQTPPPAPPQLPDEIQLTAAETMQLSMLDANATELKAQHSTLRCEFLAKEQQLIGQLNQVVQSYHDRVRDFALAHGIDYKTHDTQAAGFSWNFDPQRRVFHKVLAPGAQALPPAPDPAPAPADAKTEEPAT